MRTIKLAKRANKALLELHDSLFETGLNRQVDAVAVYDAMDTVTRIIGQLEVLDVSST